MSTQDKVDMITTTVSKEDDNSSTNASAATVTSEDSNLGAVTSSDATSVGEENEEEDSPLCVMCNKACVELCEFTSMCTLQRRRRSEWIRNRR